MAARSYRIDAVLFDFDGTLTQPGALSFSAIREALGCPAGTPILEWLADLEDEAARSEARRVLEEFELRAAAASQPNQGAEQAVKALREQGVPIAIHSRNGLPSIERALANFTSVTAADFALIVSRDEPVPHKPAPEGVLLAAAEMGVQPGRLLVVGDYIFDVQAGQAAGALTALLTNGTPPLVDDADFVLTSLDELPALVARGRPLPLGKLPNELLGALLSHLPVDDSLLVAPGVGEDVAAVDLTGAEVLLLKTDPITFATREPARYALQVNANDLATAGARPRWFLATVLLPPGTTPSEAMGLLEDLARAAAAQGITLAGGHTEITDAVTRPVVSGSLAGTISREDLIDKAAVRPGDAVFLTKAVAVEGTALLAFELEDRLLERGAAPEELTRWQGFLDRLSVVPEALAAAGIPGVTGMHDVTEGGLATAVAELAQVIACRIDVDLDRVPVYAETERVCALLGADPLGLIGSGSLLICCRPEAVDRLLSVLAALPVPATVIGRVSQGGPSVRATRAGRTAAWPRFDRDEAARLLSRPL